MTKENEQLKTLVEIKSMMERSSRFISLSGISGVSAGIFALIGSFASFIFLNVNGLSGFAYSYSKINIEINQNFIIFFLIDSFLVLSLSIIFGIYFTTKNARKKGLKKWDKTTELTLINLFVPLIVGGLFCVALFFYNILFLIAPCMLLFYGLALINASKYTFNDIRYLGYIELIIGLVACFFVEYGLLAWAIGFGIMHIIYGLKMYYKYEK